MTQPFIQDALEALSELRMLFGEKRRQPAASVAADALAESNSQTVWLRVRTGELLVESFARRFGVTLSECGPTSPYCLDAAADFGLIFNTSLAGAFPHWPIDEPEDLTDCRGTLPEQEHKCPKFGTVEPAGGRLILTNLGPQVFSARQTADVRPERLPLVVLHDERIPLVKAAALSSNFPPVFSNAAIDYYGHLHDNPDSGHQIAARYWVTDGGAVENRGGMTLLFALRNIIEQLKVQGKTLPDIHVVILDAGAIDFEFSEDRGIGTAFGASTHLANELMAELYNTVELLYRDAGGRMYLHILAMPTVLRSKGLETHWMMPASITFRRPPEALSR
jgi:hypothetical protein